jgi:formate hydrogenlyase transcriptional activator
MAWGLAMYGHLKQNQPSMHINTSTQLSASHSNRNLVHREIEKRETLQARFFAFSSAIAAETDAISLAKVLRVQLKEIFEINEYAVFGLNAEKSTYKPLLYDIDASAAKPANVRHPVQTESAINHAIDNIRTRECPVFLPLQDWEQLTAPLGYKSRAAGKYACRLLGVPIRIGQETIAVMTFSHDHYDKMRQELSLFKSILSQIAIVVCNIIAQIKISSQSTEITLYKKRLTDQQIQEKDNIVINHHNSEMIGECPAIRQVFRLIQQVASTDSTVLILGKDGNR